MAREILRAVKGGTRVLNYVIPMTEDDLCTLDEVFKPLGFSRRSGGKNALLGFARLVKEFPEFSAILSLLDESSARFICRSMIDAAYARLHESDDKSNNDAGAAF